VRKQKIGRQIKQQNTHTVGEGERGGGEWGENEKRSEKCIKDSNECDHIRKNTPKPNRMCSSTEFFQAMPNHQQKKKYGFNTTIKNQKGACLPFLLGFLLLLLSLFGLLSFWLVSFLFLPLFYFFSPTFSRSDSNTTNACTCCCLFISSPSSISHPHTTYVCLSLSKN
jgi:hypothetical protein